MTIEIDLEKFDRYLQSSPRLSTLIRGHTSRDRMVKVRIHNPKGHDFWAYRRKNENPHKNEYLPESKIWERWQKYYKEKLYKAPAEGEPHETAVAQIIMMSKSPEEAVYRIDKLQEDFPSSVHADLKREFISLYIRTRNEVLPEHQKLSDPGWIQLER